MQLTRPLLPQRLAFSREWPPSVQAGRPILPNSIGCDAIADPAGELQVIGFHAGYRRANPFTFLFFGLMQFHMGIRVAGLAKAETGHFNPHLMLNALVRGAAMNIDLTDKWDPWEVMDRDIDEFRAEYNIAPQSQANAANKS